MSAESSQFCELRIRLTADEASGTYRVHAESPALPKAAEASRPLAHLAKAQELAQAVREGRPTLDDIRKLGNLLFDALLSGLVRDAYRYVEGKAGASGMLRLLLEIESRELQRLPWECAFDLWRGDWVGRCERSCIMRLVDEQSLVTPINGRLKVVVAISLPPDPDGKKAEEEWQTFKAALSSLEAEGLVRPVRIGGKLQEVQNELQAGADVFHFIGHGGIEDGVPGLYLDDDGSRYFVGATDLRNRFFAPLPTGERYLQLVVLSACVTAETPRTEGYSSLASALAGKAQAVVAMQYPISPEGARAFNGALYARLAERMPLDAAISTAAGTLIGDKPRDQLDWMAPVVVITPQASPESMLWTTTQNPFKGAKNYEAKDRRLFLCREQELDTLQGRLVERGIKSAVVWGPPACGKTSLLRAGLEASLVERGTPVLYASLDQDVEARLREGFEGYIEPGKKEGLRDSPLVEMLPYVRREQTVILDRLEQAEHLGEWAKELVRALIGWVSDETAEVRQARLVLATREEADERPPAWLRDSLPDWRESGLRMEELDRTEAEEMMVRATQNAVVKFQQEACTAILAALQYESEHDMIKLQVVCQSLFLRAKRQNRGQVDPGFLREIDGGIEGILEQEYKVGEVLKKKAYGEGGAARRVLAQFVASDGHSMRKCSWEQLRVRAELPRGELARTLDLLEEDGLVRSERYQGQDYYELAHEKLTGQINWLTPADMKLREVEEMVDGARWVILREGPDGGLEKIKGVRDRLRCLPKQQQMLLRSALEAGYEIESWFRFVDDWAGRLEILTEKELSPEARIRTVPYLCQIAARDRGSETSRQALEALRDLARRTDSPELNQRASLGLAGVLEEDEAIDLFGPEPLGPYTLSALAWIYDTRHFRLSRLSKEGRRQVRRRLLRLTTWERRGAALRAGLVTLAGFAIAAALNMVLLHYLDGARPPFVITAFSIVLAGMLAGLLALPGAYLAPAIRDWWTVLAGGRRTVVTAAGTVVGCTIGWALTISAVALLARQPDLPKATELLQYVGTGTLLGLAIGLSWGAANLLCLGDRPLHIGRSLKLRPQIPLAAWILVTGGMGALAVWAAQSQCLGWWPEFSLYLTPPAKYVDQGWTPLTGAIVGMGSALGLAIGKLERRVPEEWLPAGSGGRDD